jgi:prepilin-type N-terminal cleavage/methylation domain
MRLIFKKSLFAHRQGMSLVEVVVASTIITVFVVALIGVYNLHLKSIFAAPRQVKASFLNEEGVEAVKYLRNLSWGTHINPLSLETEYFLVWQNNRYELTTTNTYVDSLFERKIIFSEVLRDAQSNIVEVGGTVDSNIKKVVVTTSWREGSATSTKHITTYIADLFDN